MKVIICYHLKGALNPPPLSPGSPLYNFNRAVTQQLNALVYPTVPSNLSEVVSAALKWLKKREFGGEAR